MRAVRHRRLAWSVIAEPVDAAVDAVRLAYRRRLVEELESRIAVAVTAGHLPDQDAALAAAALVGALLEGLIGPLAPPMNGDADARASVQTLALLTLRALGVVDARARGLVVQTTMPPAE
jgi:AcrR family transcriptional regulator